MGNKDVEFMPCVNVVSSNATDDKHHTQDASDTDEHRNAFERYINFSAIVNFGFTLQCGWESVALMLQLVFLNGGPASLVYGTILSGIGSTAIALSLGEMASM